MHGPTCIFWPSLTPFSLQAFARAASFEVTTTSDKGYSFASLGSHRILAWEANPTGKCAFNFAPKAGEGNLVAVKPSAITQSHKQSWIILPPNSKQSQPPPPPTGVCDTWGLRDEQLPALFDEVDSFANQTVDLFVSLRAELAPSIELGVSEFGVTLSNDIDSKCAQIVANRPSFQLAAAAVFGYGFGLLAERGIDFVLQSQYTGHAAGTPFDGKILPSNYYPGLALFNWSTGALQPRSVVNQIIVAHLEPGVDRMILSGQNSSSSVYSLGFVSAAGAHKLLLVNKVPTPSRVAIDAQLQGGTVWMVDGSYVSGVSPRKVASVGTSLSLPPFAVCVVVVKLKAGGDNIRVPQKTLKMAGMGAPLAAALLPLAQPRQGRQLRWYASKPSHLESFFLGSNPEGLLNTTQSVSDVTAAVYQCCGGFRLTNNGTLSSRNGTHAVSPGWNTSAFAAAKVDMYMTLVSGAHCEADGTPRPGDTTCNSPAVQCAHALAVADTLAAELIAQAKAFGLKGWHLDWEYGYGNNVSRHVELWTKVTQAFKPHGLELALSVNDVATQWNISSTSWAYLEQWKYFTPFADILINMGTYPLVKLWHGPPRGTGPPYSIPTNQNPVLNHSFGSKRCLPPLSSRWCGLEGQIEDMVRNGANGSSGQLQLGIQASGDCTGDGLTTGHGWTEPSLEHFLAFADTQGVRVLTVWTENAFVIPRGGIRICDWFVPTLLRWARAPIKSAASQLKTDDFRSAPRREDNAVPSNATLIIDGSASPNESYTLSGGVGAMSTAGTSRLLIDYAEPHRSQVLDYLFRPRFGASLQHLKVTLGGDGECTSGSEPATMRTATAEDYRVGYEMWLMAEARRRNPGIVLYGLPLSWPAWVGNGTGSPYSDVALTAAYVTKWCTGAQSVWNVSIDYIGIWNERGYTKPYLLELRRQLDAASLQHVKIVGSDAKWDPISSDVLKDAELRAAVSVLSSHCERALHEKHHTPTASRH